MGEVDSTIVNRQSPMGDGRWAMADGRKGTPAAEAERDGGREGSVALSAQS